MKTKLFLIVISIFYFSSVKGQNAKDVLEDAVGMKESQHILFTKSDVKNVTDKEVEYQILGTSKIGILKDSIMFLVKGELVKTYLTPLNPLDYSFESKNELKPDQIDASAANALKDIVTYVKKYQAGKDQTFSAVYKGFSLETIEISNIKCNPTFEDLNNLLDKIKDSLNNHYKIEISKTFQSIKGLDFKNKENTRVGIDNAKKASDKYKKHYGAIDTEISNFKDKVLTYNCGDDKEVFLIKNLFNQIIKDLISVKKEQFKRVENLELAVNSVNKTYLDATANAKCDWCIEIKPNATLEKGKISSYTFTINKSGYRLTTLSDKGQDIDEITSEESKEIDKKVFYFRKFRRFVPEVSSGIAYTNLDFPKFGAVTDDSTNELKVAKIGEDNIKRINITAMINYNYYVNNSDIHPFIQLGAGINTDFPTLFLGSGLRFNAFDGGRFAISVGFAGSWIKSLDSLKIGDVVKDDSDVEKDITYEFAKPKLYYGIQFNF